MNRAHVRPVRRWVGELLLGIWILGAVACSSEGETSAGFTVRDSAGVTIVETAEPAWHEGSEWHVSPEPLVEIGVRDGDPTHQFTMVTTALRLPTGDIIVGDLQTAEVRRFDAGGAHVWTAGGHGRGPGEFSGIARVWRAVDTLVVYDPFGSRVSYLDLDGQFLRAERIQFEHQVSLIEFVFWGRFPDGTFLARSNYQFAKDLAPGSGLVRDTVPWLRLTPTGALVDTVGRFPGYEGYGFEVDGEATVRTHPFGPHGPVVLGRDGSYAGDGDRFEIDVYDFDGQLRRRIRRTGFMPPRSRRRIWRSTSAAHSRTPTMIAGDRESSAATRRCRSGASFRRFERCWWTRKRISGSRPSRSPAIHVPCGPSSTPKVKCWATSSCRTVCESSRSDPTTCSACGGTSSTSRTCACTS